MEYIAKIGFIAIGHKDYISDDAVKITNNAVEALRQRGHDIVYAGHIAASPGEARAIAKEMLRHDVDGAILFLSTFMECPVSMSALREFDHLPFALWGTTMFTNEGGGQDSTGSFVAFSMFQGSLKRMGYEFISVLGLSGDAAAIAKASRFCIAAGAYQRLKRSTVGLVGYSALGIYPGTFDHVMMRKVIGPEIDHLDTYTLIKATENIGDEECLPVLDYLNKVARIKSTVSKEQLLTVSKMYLAMKKLCGDRGYDAINVKCQYELSQDYGMTACVPLSILAENGVTASCEGDIPNTVSMLILHFLSGGIAAYADILNINSDRSLKMSPCGFIPYSMGRDGDRVIGEFIPGFGFKGIQNSFSYKSGEVTLLRLVEDRCDYHFLYTAGNGRTGELRQGYMPAMDLDFDGDIDRLVENLSGQHFAICYGDYSIEIEMLAKILHIGCVRL